jgi:WD40 repeat protein
MLKQLTLLALVGLALPLQLNAEERSYQILGEDRGKVVLVNSKGEKEWEFETRAQSHDLQLLPNGNVLLALNPRTVAEVSKEKKIVWKYEAKPVEGNKGGIEIHAFQRLPNGLTFIAESGNGRIVEVDRDGKIIHTITLTREHPSAHRDTRMVRKLENGNYLVCQEGDSKVREYDADSKVVWSYTVDLGGRPEAPGHGPEGHGTSLYGAIRLANGNTLIAGGNNNRVLEVNPKGEIVWKIDHNELPGIQLAWVTTLVALPNGNIIVGNCHAGPKNPQLFEITRDKKVVWTFKDFKNFDNGLASTHILGVPEGSIR